MVERKFLGKPMRDVSLEHHPIPFRLKHFVEDTKEALEAFAANMIKLGHDQKDMHIEEWFETFLAWSEVEQDPNSTFGVQEY